MSLPARIAAALGDSAADLRDAVLSAIPRAHNDAVAAQAASGTRRRDPYGHTMKNRQHECLVETGRLVTGVEVVRPHGIPFEFLWVTATNAVLFPWRYTTSARVERVDARMNVSEFRWTFLTSGAPLAQPSLLDLVGLTDDELAEHEAEATEQEAVTEALHSFTTVVTIGYASNPSALLDLGWGVIELLDRKGTVHWRDWEPLPWRSATGTSIDVRTPVGEPGGLRLAPQPTGPRNADRFDQAAPLIDDFRLTPRSPLAGEPFPEAGPDIDGTGTEFDQQ